MLGRLQMSVQECMAAYKLLLADVSQRRKHSRSMTLYGGIRGMFDSKALEQAVIDIIKGKIMEGMNFEITDEINTKIKTEINNAGGHITDKERAEIRAKTIAKYMLLKDPDPNPKCKVYI
jgi:hypothetical protein